MPTDNMVIDYPCGCPSSALPAAKELSWQSSDGSESSSARDPDAAAGRDTIFVEAEVTLQKCLALCFMASLSCRAEEITRADGYEKLETLQYRHVTVHMNPVEPPRDGVCLTWKRIAHAKRAERGERESW